MKSGLLARLRRGRSDPAQQEEESSSPTEGDVNPELGTRRRHIRTLEDILKEDPVDLKKLRQTAWIGIPRSKRKMVWMLL